MSRSEINPHTFHAVITCDVSNYWRVSKNAFMVLSIAYFLVCNKITTA